jgi:hypothetical protein
MLSKLKQTPFKVTLAILVLIAIFGLIAWTIPGAVIAIGIAAGTAWSVFVLLEYFIGSR